MLQVSGLAAERLMLVRAAVVLFVLPFPQVGTIDSNRNSCTLRYAAELLQTEIKEQDEQSE